MPLSITLIFPQSGQTQQQKPQPPPQDKNKHDDEARRIDTDLVRLNAIVANLKQSDFSIYEDRVKQQLEYFNTGDHEPINLGIIFDTSGSMVDKIDGVRDAVEYFVKEVASGDEILMIQFHNRANLVQDFTDEKGRILSAIDRLRPNGSTALYDAIVMGLDRVDEANIASAH